MTRRPRPAIGARLSGLVQHSWRTWSFEEKQSLLPWALISGTQSAEHLAEHEGLSWSLKEQEKEAGKPGQLGHGVCCSAQTSVRRG